MNRSLVEKRPILGLFCKEDLIITGAYKLWPHYVTCRICRLLRKGGEDGNVLQCVVGCCSVLNVQITAEGGGMMAVCCSVLQCVAAQCVECVDYRGRGGGAGEDATFDAQSAVCCHVLQSVFYVPLRRGVENKEDEALCVAA